MGPGPPTASRICVSGRPRPVPRGYVAVVTQTGLGDSVTESAGRIWAGLVRRYGPPLVLLEHYPAPELAEGVETLHLVRIGADGSPHWTRVRPAPQDHPRHAGLEVWMASYGHLIIGRPRELLRPMPGRLTAISAPGPPRPSARPVNGCARAAAGAMADCALFGEHDGMMGCQCRTPSCRGTIGGRDWQRPDLQRKYGTYFSSYRLHRVAANRTGPR